MFGRLPTEEDDEADGRATGDHAPTVPLRSPAPVNPPPGPAATVRATGEAAEYRRPAAGKHAEKGTACAHLSPAWPGSSAATSPSALLRAGHEVVGIDNLAPVLRRSPRSSRTSTRCGPSARPVRLRAARPADDDLDPRCWPGSRSCSTWPVSPASGSRGPTASSRYERLQHHRDPAPPGGACGDRPLRRFVFASSSSVYGNAARYPTDRGRPAPPAQPLRGDQAGGRAPVRPLRRGARGARRSSLRYFTVYGPGQRPDMLMHRLFEAALDRRPGAHLRDGRPGAGVHLRRRRRAGQPRGGRGGPRPRAPSINIAGGSETTVGGGDRPRRRADRCGRCRSSACRPQAGRRGQRTGGSIERARDLLGWEPRRRPSDGPRGPAGVAPRESSTSPERRPVGAERRGPEADASHSPPRWLGLDRR